MDSNFRPKLRALEMQWIEREGQPALLLQDRLSIGTHAVVVPQLLVPLLALCDGSRDLAALPAAYELRTGIRLEQELVERVLSQLDDALMLESGQYHEARRKLLESYRAAPFRPAALAGSSYPSDSVELRALLDGYLAEAIDGRDGDLNPRERLRGLICPHIDYDRGGPVYAQLFARARAHLSGADRFIILGTDHAGGPAQITLTRQSYHTPFGTLATDVEAVELVAEAMGEEAAYDSELNHRTEHSVELAAVWIHHLVGDREVRIVPVLCGSFHPFTEGNGRPLEDERWRAGALALRQIAATEGTVVVAAADLAHVGPAFGDPEPVGSLARKSLSASDAEMLGMIDRGDAEGFLDMLVQERDRRKVCGLPPIYLAMKSLGAVAGETVAYSICPAPEGSVVSVTGVLLWEGGEVAPF